MSIAEKTVVLPKGTFVSRWIPVSERLPEEAGVYLVTMKDHEVYELSFSDERWFVQGNDEIVAWMPLPEPYKSESEDKE